MGISDVVENLRSLKQTVKKPITAFRETVHNAYTKAYVGSPERVDEFYNYIKVYTPSKHNDLCMMSITADINRFSMIPDKNTFFHVLKLERHFDRMIAARKQPDVTGDMAIQILSGHNTTFMSKYRRYKTRSAAKELKRRNQRFKALNVRRHTQLPDSGNDDSCIYGNRTPLEMPVLNLLSELDLPKETQSTSSSDITVLKLAAEVVPAPKVETKGEARLLEPKKKDVSIVCELTKAETVIAAPALAQNVVVALPVKEDDSLAISAAKANLVQKKHHSKSSTEKSMMSVTKKHDAKFKVAKSVTVKKERIEKAENLKASDVVEKKTAEVTIATSLLEDVMEQLTLDEQKGKKETQKPKIVVELSDSDSHEEFDKCDEDSDDGSDIEELEKIEDKDVDALEYEMI